MKSKTDYQQTIKSSDLLDDFEFPANEFDSKQIRQMANVKRRLERKKGNQSSRRSSRLFVCDFRDLPNEAKIKRNSIDLVLTDIAWQHEAIKDWKPLAETFFPLLKKDGLFATYIGQKYLSRAINELESGGLFYQWTFPIIFDLGS